MCTIETGGAFSRDCPTSGGNKKQVEASKPPRISTRETKVSHAVGSNDDAVREIRHAGARSTSRGGGARAGRDGRGTRDAPAEHGAGYAGFPALDVRVQRRGHGGLGGLPGKRPDEPHAHRGPDYRRSETRRQRVEETRRETNCRRGGGRGARGEARADPAATRRCRARSRGNIARERGRAPRSTRAPRAFAGRAPSCRHLGHIRGDGSHACSTKGARRRRAWAARASAREARRGLRRVERSRHEPPRRSGGENRTRSRTYLVTSPVLMSRRSCLSTRTAAFLNTPPVAAGREEGGIKSERERSANARDVRDVPSTFDRARRGIVPRLAPERVAPSPTGHAMPRAAWDVSVPRMRVLNTSEKLPRTSFVRERARALLAHGGRGLAASVGLARGGLGSPPVVPALAHGGSHVRRDLTRAGFPRRSRSVSRWIDSELSELGISRNLFH